MNELNTLETRLNNLLEQDIIKTNGIREKDDKGKHTTTSRNLFVLNDKRIVIDEPGIRWVASFEMNSDLNSVFSKISELEKECKYTTCTHENRNGCKVLEAIDNGEISEEEFQKAKNGSSNTNESADMENGELLAEMSNMYVDDIFEFNF